MGEALVQRITCCIYDICRRIKIGLANLEMNNFAALCFQRSRPYQNFESGLGAKTRHAFGETEFVGLSHDAEISIINALSQLVFS